MSGQAATNIAASSDAPRVAPAALAAFVKRAFEAAGLPSADAEIAAGLMVEADLRGSDTHGVIRLPLYLRRLKAGGINARPHIRIVEERPATALVDGDNGMGHLVMRFATQVAIEPVPVISPLVLLAIPAIIVVANAVAAIPARAAARTQPATALRTE